MKRRYRTEYFAGAPAGKLPLAVGTTNSLPGARRAIAARIVLGEYGFACVTRTATGEVVSYMHRGKHGVSVRDTPGEDEFVPSFDSQTKVDEARNKLVEKLERLGLELSDLSAENRRRYGLG